MTYQKNLRILALSLITFIPGLALSYSVQDAIIEAHENNNDIMAKLEKVRADRLARPKQIMSEFLPDISAAGQYNKIDLKRYPSAAAAYQKYPNSKTLTITQPIFNSGGSLARMMATNSGVNASEANFMAESQQLSLQTVQTYEDVITKRAIYDLSIQNKKLAASLLEYTQIRFKHGEVTKTDVLQAQANFANAEANLENSISSLQGAEATFERLTGRPVPKELDKVDINKVTLPPNLEEFISYALENNPSYLAAKHTHDQADYSALASVSNVLPSVSAQAQRTKTNKPKQSSSSLNTDGDTYTMQVSIPIVPKGGAGFVEIFENKHKARTAKYNAKATESSLRENAVQSWSGYKSYLAQLKAQKEAIEFNAKSLEGIREEEKIGTRTTIDVLEAQQKLFDANVQYKRIEQALVNLVYSILSINGQIDTINIEERK